jgi:hypothetical protein
LLLGPQGQIDAGIGHSHKVHMAVSQSLVIAAAFVAGFGCMFALRLVWALFSHSLHLLLFAGLAVAALHFVAPEQRSATMLKPMALVAQSTIENAFAAYRWLHEHRVQISFEPADKPENNKDS